MAYKFQTLAATMSGSLTQEGDFTVKNDAGVTGFSATAGGVVSGSGALSAGGAFRTRGTARFDGVVQAAVDISADSIYYFDATDNLMKTETVGAFVTDIAGPGLAQVGGALEFDLSEFAALSATPHATQDSYLISDGGTEKTITVTHAANGAFALVSGDALIAAGGALTIQAGAVENSMLADDAVGADELAANAVVNASIAAGAAIDMDKLDGGSCASALTDLAQGDFLYAGDIDASNAIKSITFSNFEDAIFGNVSGDATIAAGGALTLGSGVVEHGMLAEDIISGQGELAQGALAAADEFMISDGGTIKRYGVDSFAKDALALTTEDAIANGDYITFLDGGATGETKKEALADLATLFAGDGLSAASSVMAVQVSGAVHVSSDKVALSGSVAGTGLTYTGGVDSILTLALDIPGQTNMTGDVADTDEMMISDGGTLKRIDFSVFRDAVFNDVSGDATVAAGGALTLASNSVSNAQLDNDAVTGAELADNAVDSEHYTDGSIDTAHIANNQITVALMAVNSIDSDQYVDGSIDTAHYAANSVDTAALGADAVTGAQLADNAVDSEHITAGSVDDAHLSDGVATGLAGAGLTATSGVLSVTGNNVALKADGNALVEGYNYFADASSNATVTLPTTRAVGDVVIAKAGNLTSNAIITINKGDASDRIDGLESIILESPYASVTMVYVVANAWRIV